MKRWKSDAGTVIKEYVPLEHDDQAGVIHWKNLYVIEFPCLKMLFAVPNQAVRTQQGKQWMVKEGAQAGIPDLLLPAARAGKFGLAIELKRQNGVSSDVSKKQQSWLEAFREFNWHATVCYGKDHAIKILTWYCKEQPTAVFR